MPTSQQEAVLKTIDGMSSKLVELTQHLIREKSVNLPGDETGPALVLADELSSIGLKVREHEAASKRVNVEANLPSPERGLRFLFNGHMDVVPEGDLSKWTVDPFARCQIPFFLEAVLAISFISALGITRSNHISSLGSCR